MATSSITRAKAPVLAMVLASVVLLVGCSSGVEKSSQTPGPTEQEPNAAERDPGSVTPFTKVEQDDLADVGVEALTDTVTWDAVTEAALRPAEPKYGELFAVLAAQYVTDSRDHELPAVEVDQLLDGPTSLHNFLVSDHAGQVDLGTKRYIDVRISPWIRSDVEDTGTLVIRTQLNAFIRASVGGYPADSWVRFRMDVRHDGTRWRLTGFINATGSSDLKLTAWQKELYFYSGEGWRRIPASS